MKLNRWVIGGIGIFVVALLWLTFGKKNESVVEVKAEAGRAPVKALYEEATNLKNERDLVKAKEAYRTILLDYPDFEEIEKVQNDLNDVNMEIILSNTPTEQTVIHDVLPGDTLGALAKKYNTTIEFVKLSNNLKNNIIRVGQKLRIWTAPFNIFVDKSQNILLLKTNDEVLKIYNVSTGSNNSTPVGEFTITSKLIDPVWFNKGVVVPPESPANVLGTRWLGFDLPGYGIHGTVEPDNIGKQVTAGCVRMRNSEVEELYSIIPMGTKVVVVD